MSDVSDARFRRNRWKSRLRRLRPLLITLVVLGVLTFGGWVVMASSWLAADHVDVSGEQTLSRDEVLQAAGIDLGTPLVRIDLDAVHDRIAELPSVAAVTVHRAWPQGITISVQERTPLATIRRDNQWWALDRDGVLFRPTATRDPDLVLVKVPARAGDDAVREAASVVAALPRQMLASTRRLSAHSMDSITLELKGDRQVVWGNSAESHRKVEVLSTLLDAARAHTYDVSVPGLPTTRG